MSEEAGGGGQAEASAPPPSDSGGGESAPADSGGDGGGEPATADSGGAEPASDGGGEPEPSSEGGSEPPADPATEEGSADKPATDGESAEKPAAEEAAPEETPPADGAQPPAGEEKPAADEKPAGEEKPAADEKPAEDRNGEDGQPATEPGKDEGAPPNQPAADSEKTDFQRQVENLAPPPSPADRILEIADTTKGVSDDTTPVRDGGERFSRETERDWPDQSGVSARSRSAESAEHVNTVSTDAQALSKYAQTTANEVEAARQKAQATTEQYERDNLVNEMTPVSEGEHEFTRRRLAQEAANDNHGYYAAAAERVREAAPTLTPTANSQSGPIQGDDDDGFQLGDLLDPFPQGIMGDVNDAVDAAMPKFQSEGPEVGGTPPTLQPNKDSLAKGELHAYADQGTWSMFRDGDWRDQTKGEYAIGADLSGQVNRPGADGPLVSAELTTGGKLNLDEIQVLDGGGVTASVTPEVRLGPGAAVEFDPKFENGEFSLKGRVSASPLFGSGLNFDVKLNKDELARSLDSVWRGAFG